MKLRALIGNSGLDSSAGAVPVNFRFCSTLCCLLMDSIAERKSRIFSSFGRAFSMDGMCFLTCSYSSMRVFLYDCFVWRIKVRRFCVCRLSEMFFILETKNQLRIKAKSTKVKPLRLLVRILTTTCCLLVKNIVYLTCLFKISSGFLSLRVI